MTSRDEYEKELKEAIEYANPMAPPEFWRKERALAMALAARDKDMRRVIGEDDRPMDNEYNIIRTKLKREQRKAAGLS